MRLPAYTCSTVQFTLNISCPMWVEIICCSGRLMWLDPTPSHQSPPVSTRSTSSIPTPTTDRSERVDWVTASRGTTGYDRQCDKLTGWHSDYRFARLTGQRRHKRKFLQNRGWSDLRIWIEWQQMKSQNDTETSSQCLNCLLTTNLVSPGWWEDQPLDVSTLYYSLVSG